MNLDYINYPYKSRRTTVFGKNAMAASSNSYATIAGIEIMNKGGNCVDAAIAMAMVHVVVEPTSNGLGSDAFAIVSIDDRLFGLNASGPAPKKLTIDYLKSCGYDSIPEFGPLTIDVPGAVSGWIELHKRFGKLPFEEICKPAIEFAEEGFVLTPTISILWKREIEKYNKFKEKKYFEGFFNTFTKNGKAPNAGEVIKLKDHAQTLKQIRDSYGESFYKGELATKISKYVKNIGGVLEESDLKNYKAEWVDPISTSYKGYDVWEIPPNGQGLTVLLAMSILNGMNIDKRDKSLKTHYEIEAMKSAFADAKYYIAEPCNMKKSVKELLGEKHIESRRKILSEKAVVHKCVEPYSGGTIYLACADKDGNMTSFIQSNYKGFGSGVVVDGTGISLNNRAFNFSFNKDSPNALKGGTRPYHTIIPGFLTKDGKSLAAFGVMGEYMQPQGHLQTLIRMIDEGMNPQAALDAPRWQWTKDLNIEIEEDYDKEIVEDLKRRGHNIKVLKDRTRMGRGEIILKHNGIYAGATEPRTDGCVLGI